MPAGFVLREEFHRAQMHQAADPGAQREGRTIPPNRPGEILPEAIVPFPLGSCPAGGKMDAEVQRNAANGAEYEVPKRGGT